MELNVLEKIKAIRIWQGTLGGKWGSFTHHHEMTCGNNSNHAVLEPKIHADESVSLYCTDCDYTQDKVPDIVYEDYYNHKGHCISRAEDGTEEHFDTIGEMMDAHREKEGIWEKIWDIITLPFYRIYYKCIDRPYYRAKYWIQKRVRGYSDLQLWNVGYDVLNYAYPLFKAYVKMDKMGHPSAEGIDCPEDWDAILKKIEKAFDEYKLDEDGDFKWDTAEELQEHYKVMNEGFTLFGKYLLNMWD